MPKITDHSWKIAKPCETCGKDFYPKDGMTKPRWLERRFCGRVCASKGEKPILRTPMEERFWSKIDKTPGQGPNGDCWGWTAHTAHWGHGRISFPGGRSHIMAHRYSYQLVHGSIDPEDDVCHRCDNPPCCNPDHLFLGSAQDNMKDMWDKGRGPHGINHYLSKLTENDVRAIRKDARPLKDIAEQYGVTKTNVSYIRLRKSWKRLPD